MLILLTAVVVGVMVKVLVITDWLAIVITIVIAIIVCCFSDISSDGVKGRPGSQCSLGAPVQYKFSLSPANPICRYPWC